MPRKHHWGLGAGILKTQVASEVLLMEGRLVLVSRRDGLWLRLVHAPVVVRGKARSELDMMNRPGWWRGKFHS